MTIHQRPPVDPRILALYNDYAHGRIDRRTFITKGTKIAGGISAAALLASVMPDYAAAQQISFTDPRIRAERVEYPSARGSGRMGGYLVRPMQSARPAPAVIVIHENRGLNPYVEDVARRAAAQGFLALAPDGLFPVGGYPGNDDAGRTLQQQLDPAKLNEDLIASARWLKTHPDSNGMLGATGFCYGGGMVNRIAVALGADLNAAVPYYGAAAPTADVPKIKAAMMVQYAETDEGINAQRADFENALKAANVKYVMHVYPGTMHGFHNDSTPRFVPAQAKISEDRMWAHFRENLKKA